MMKGRFFILLLCSLFLVSCTDSDRLYYLSSAKYIMIYQYKSDRYFDYITFKESPQNNDYIYPTIVPVLESKEPLWKTRDCGKYGKDLVMHLNSPALESLSFCDLLQKEIFRLENSCFIYANRFLVKREWVDDYKIYNIKRNDYCKGFDSDTLQCIEDYPYSHVFSIPIEDITNGIGETTPTFNELIEYLNNCINDS